MPASAPEITPHSFLELHYVTANPDDNREATLLGTTLEEWIGRVAIPSRTISRFATFNVVQGLVTVNGLDIAVQSERYGLSGCAYIDGVECEVNESDISKGLALVSFEGQIDEAFVKYHLAILLARQSVKRAVVGRFGNSIHPFDPSKDTILHSKDYKTF